MTAEEFIEELCEMLQTDAQIDRNTVLTSMEEWDSLAGMILVTYFDKKFGRLHTYEKVMGCKTCGDLLDLAGIE